MGWVQGDWTWVRNRRRKALRPVQDGRNGQRQSNEHGGKDFSEDRRKHQHGRVFYRSRSVSLDRGRGDSPRVRVLHDSDRGRSLTYRRGALSHSLVKVGIVVGLGGILVMGKRSHSRTAMSIT